MLLWICFYFYLSKLIENLKYSTHFYKNLVNLTILFSVSNLELSPLKLSAKLYEGFWKFLEELLEVFAELEEK